MEEEYKPNSHKSKEEAKESQTIKQGENPKQNPKRVVENKVTIREPNEFQKFFREFIVDDIRSATKKAIHDFFIPSLKAACYKTITNVFGMMFGINPDTTSGTNGTKVAYTQFSAKNNSTAASESKPKMMFNLSDVVIPTSYEAENVIFQIRNILEMYGVVSVSDVYEMLDIEVPYTAAKYGWKYLPEKIAPYPVEGGFIIRLPKPTVID